MRDGPTNRFAGRDRADRVVLTVGRIASATCPTPTPTRTIRAPTSSTGRWPGAAPIGEVYCKWVPVVPVAVTIDCQIVGNPGYNRDRGPANVVAVRLHGHF